MRIVMLVLVTALCGCGSLPTPPSVGFSQPESSTAGGGYVSEEANARLMVDAATTNQSNPAKAPPADIYWADLTHETILHDGEWLFVDGPAAEDFKMGLVDAFTKMRSVPIFSDEGEFTLTWRNVIWSPVTGTRENQEPREGRTLNIVRNGQNIGAVFFDWGERVILRFLPAYEARVIEPDKYLVLSGNSRRGYAFENKEAFAVGPAGAPSQAVDLRLDTVAKSITSAGLKLVPTGDPWYMYIVNNDTKVAVISFVGWSTYGPTSESLDAAEVWPLKGYWLVRKKGS